MVHHRFDLEASDGAGGVRRKSGGGGGLDRMSRALHIPPTEVFEIVTQHRYGDLCVRATRDGTRVLAYLGVTWT